MSFFTKLADLLYRDRSNAWKAAVSTAVISFVSLFAMSLLGFLGDVTDWANGSGGDFPSVAPLGKALISAVVASVIGLINWVIRSLQAHSASIPGAGPQYGTLAPPPPPAD